MASKKKITGLTVQIGADTTDFNKAMSDSSKKSKSLKSELAEVERMLKFDPTNVELIAQKQKILNEQVQESSKRLDLLKQVQNEVNQKYKDGEIGEETYRNFQRQVIKAEDELKRQKDALEKVENSAKDTDKALADASEQAQELGKKKLTDFKKEIDDVKSAASDLKDTIKDTVGEAAAAGSAVIAGATTAVVTANENKKATNNLQAMTGLSASEVQQYSDLIENVYKNNFGENQSEVANVIALIKQNLKDIDDSKLQSVTEDLFTLSDTFDFDYTESLRAVKMLTDQFGISTEEAFNLIVQGAQNGLNKNGDMLDSINEYSVHYKQLGYSAEEFFNSLENGTAAGTFSVDKLGDAMKEFGIRSKDTATTTTEGFELIGLNADEMRAKFAEGGETAKKATDETLTALFSLDDQVKINQAGVDLFGTMWEDLGIDGVKALMNVKGSADKTKNSMEKIKEVKYDDLISDFEGLGRTVQTDIIAPLGKDLYPTAKKVCEFLIKNLDKIIPSLKLVAGIGASIWVGSKVTAFTKGITQLITTYKALKTATEAAKVSQTALNVAQNTNVVGLAITAIGTLVSTMVAFSDCIDDNSGELDEWQGKIDAAKQKNDDLTESYNNFITKRDEAVSNAQSENNYYDKLWDELQSIVDENGKVIGGYEDRAKFITEKLGDMTGTEIRLNDGVVQKYGELRDTIQEVIDKKKANNILSAYEPSYQEAVSNTETQKKAIDSSQSEYEKAQEETKKAQEDYRRIIGQIQNIEEQARKEPNTNEKYRIRAKTMGLQIKADEAKEILNRAKETEQIKKSDVEIAKKKLQEYLSTVDNYENLQSAILSDSSDNVNDALRKIQNSFISAKVGTEKTLEEQCVSYRFRLAEIQKAIAEGKTDYYTADDLTELQLLLKASEDELAKFKADAGETGREADDELASGIEENSDVVKQSATKAAKKGTRGADEVKGDFFSKGVGAGSEYSSGIASKGGEAENAGTKISRKAKNGTGSISLFNTGINFVQGFINGLLNGDIVKKVWNSAVSIGNNALNAVKKVLGIHSPSKEAQKLGSYFSEGMSIGIDGKRYKVKRSADSVAQAMLDSFNFDENGKILNFDTAKLAKISDMSKTENKITVEMSTVTDKLDRLIEITKKNSDKKIYLDSGELVGSTTKKYDESLADLSVKKKRGW